jgi:hypothetical protein
VSFGDSVRLGDIVIPTDARSRVLIDYAGPQGTIPHISAADVLGGKGLERVKDRVVFIGATAEGCSTWVTPFSPNMPGVEKHANMAANISTALHRPPGVDRAGRDGRHHRVPAAAGPCAAGHAAGAEHLHAGGGGGPVRRRNTPSGASCGSPRLPSRRCCSLIAVTVYRFFTRRQRQYTKRVPAVREPRVGRGSWTTEALQFGGEMATSPCSSRHPRLHHLHRRTTRSWWCRCPRSPR